MRADKAGFKAITGTATLAVSGSGEGPGGERRPDVMEKLIIKLQGRDGICQLIGISCHVLAYETYIALSILALCYIVEWFDWCRLHCRPRTHVTV